MKKGIFAVALFWLTIVGLSFLWNLVDEKREHDQLALETARAFYRQIVITRAWNAEHGGVYVPVSDSVRPNIYLEDPLRDIVTENGLALTKINPAYMTRQIAEISSRQSGIQFHITSLNPLRPQNKATDWEQEWLQSFENGVREQSAFVLEGDTTVFRYMAPLQVEKNCLRCHAKQGYVEGEIRGGISVTIPYLTEQSDTVMFIGYGITALAGVIFTVAGGTLLARRREELIQANATLEKGIAEREKLIHKLQEANNQIQTLSGIVPICMYCKGIRDDQGYWNRVEKFISQHSAAQFSHGICPKCMKEKHPDIDLDSM